MRSRGQGVCVCACACSRVCVYVRTYTQLFQNYMLKCFTFPVETFAISVENKLCCFWTLNFIFLQVWKLSSHHVFLSFIVPSILLSGIPVMKIGSLIHPVCSLNFFLCFASPVMHLYILRSFSTTLPQDFLVFCLFVFNFIVLFSKISFLSSHLTLS